LKPLALLPTPFLIRMARNATSLSPLLFFLVFFLEYDLSRFGLLPHLRFFVFVAAGRRPCQILTLFVSFFLLILGFRTLRPLFYKLILQEFVSLCYPQFLLLSLLPLAGKPVPFGWMFLFSRKTSRTLPRCCPAPEEKRGFLFSDDCRFRMMAFR